MWFDKYPENWTEAHSEEELLQILRHETQRMVFVDFYAGFCGSCKVWNCQSTAFMLNDLCPRLPFHNCLEWLGIQIFREIICL